MIIYSSCSSRKSINLFILLLFVCHCASHYKQSLSVAQDNMVRLEFEIGTQLLPIPLQAVYQEFNSEIVILYGPYFHQYSQGLSSNTITTRLHLKNSELQTKIPEKLKQILIGSFAILIADRYGCYLKQTQQLVFNDPNDKFCGHHIEQIVKNFLPCASNSGLAQLIDLETMFSAGQTGSRMYGMKVVWDGQGMRINIYVALGKKIEGIKKLKVNQKCLGNSQLIMTDANHQFITVREIVLNRLQSSSSSNLGTHQPDKAVIKARRDIVGNWYNPKKTMQITIEAREYVNNSMLTIRELLPARAGIKNITVQHLTKQNKIDTSFDCGRVQNQREVKYNTPNILCEIRIRLSYQQPQQNEHMLIRVNIEMQNKIICFDNFETIFGGGTEIPNIPITLIQPKQTQALTYIYSGPVSLRTPQPDQSLPFQVMTFTLGIFGYLWLSIWRKLVSDIQKNRKNMKDE